MLAFLSVPPNRRSRFVLDILHPDIDRYLHNLAVSDDPVLLEMERIGDERSFPIVGPQVGRLLHMLARSIGARRVLELGSGFGYSAMWFARAVGPSGQVVLTEGSSEKAAEASLFLERAGFADRVRIEVGDALEIAQRVGDGFDIVFNDIDKQDYPLALERARSVLRPGGLFISDNMLWMGQVLDARSEEPTTRGVQELTQALHDSPLFDTVLIPIRDGVTVSTYRAS